MILRQNQQGWRPHTTSLYVCSWSYQNSIYCGTVCGGGDGSWLFQEQLHFNLCYIHARWQEICCEATQGKNKLETTVLEGAAACGSERLLMHLYRCSQAHHIRANVKRVKNWSEGVSSVYGRYMMPNMLLNKRFCCWNVFLSGSLFTPFYSNLVYFHLLNYRSMFFKYSFCGPYNATLKAK